MLVQTATVRFTVEPGGKVYATVSTPTGAAVIDLDQAMWQQGKVYTGVFVDKKTEPKLKKVSAKKTRRASIAQETEIMEALGGQRQAGSGALSHLKGDGRVRNKYRVEIKYTRRGSYKLDRAELSKIRGECHPPEQPLFVIDYVDPKTGGSPDRWVVVPFEHFRRMEYPTSAAHHPRRPTAP